MFIINNINSSSEKSTAQRGPRQAAFGHDAARCSNEAAELRSQPRRISSAPCRRCWWSFSFPNLTQPRTRNGQERSLGDNNKAR
ncbi:unnamed protein product [Lampetra planeri]